MGPRGPFPSALPTVRAEKGLEASVFSLRLFPATAGIKTASCPQRKQAVLSCLALQSCVLSRALLCLLLSRGMVVDNISQHGTQDEVGLRL